VTALEENPSLFDQARSVLSSLGSLNVNVIQGHLADGAADSGPYDVILIDGGVEAVPNSLCAQLSPRGRLLAVMVAGPVGKAKLLLPVNGRFSGRELFDASAPLLPGFSVAPVFVF
jgi:protein-L-isoaspartate(D-aspartate) O-methyltransferase